MVVPWMGVKVENLNPDNTSVLRLMAHIVPHRTHKRIRQCEPVQRWRSAFCVHTKKIRWSFGLVVLIFFCENSCYLINIGPLFLFFHFGKQTRCGIEWMTLSACCYFRYMIWLCLLTVHTFHNNNNIKQTKSMLNTAFNISYGGVMPDKGDSTTYLALSPFHFGGTACLSFWPFCCCRRHCRCRRRCCRQCFCVLLDFGYNINSSIPYNNVYNKNNTHRHRGDYTHTLPYKSLLFKIRRKAKINTFKRKLYICTIVFCSGFCYIFVTNYFRHFCWKKKYNFSVIKIENDIHTKNRRKKFRSLLFIQWGRIRKRKFASGVTILYIQLFFIAFSVRFGNVAKHCYTEEWNLRAQ